MIRRGHLTEVGVRNIVLSNGKFVLRLRELEETDERVIIAGDVPPVGSTYFRNIIIVIDDVHGD